MDKDSIGKFIKELRIEKGLSQNKLAEEIHISRQAISNWECGKAFPDSFTFKILANFFDVTTDELLLGKRITKDSKESKQEIENIKLDLIDDNLNKMKKLKQIKQIFISTVIISLLLFFIYYFVNSYNTISAYKVKCEGQKFYTKEGLLVITRDKNYLKLGKIRSKDSNIIINKIKVYQKNENNKEKILFYDEDFESLITFRYGYKDRKKELNNIRNNTYIEITYNDYSKETIKLVFYKDYANDKLLYGDNYKEKKINRKSENKIKQTLENKIKKNVNIEKEVNGKKYIFNFNNTYVVVREKNKDIEYLYLFMRDELYYKNSGKEVHINNLEDKNLSKKKKIIKNNFYKIIEIVD